MIISTKRPEPRLTTPTSAPGWTWDMVLDNLDNAPTLVERFKLMFQPWKTVTAPKGTPCMVLNIYSEPLYRFKELNGKTFYLGQSPGVGFPGS